jgi:hypothetical protein
MEGRILRSETIASFYFHRYAIFRLLLEKPISPRFLIHFDPQPPRQAARPSFPREKRERIMESEVEPASRSRSRRERIFDATA